MFKKANSKFAKVEIFIEGNLSVGQSIICIIEKLNRKFFEEEIEYQIKETDHLKYILLICKETGKIKKDLPGNFHLKSQKFLLYIC